MIITTGKYKGRKLKTPKALVRPTSSKIRESIFNMIDIKGMKVLDLFSGSGIMGLEALSRGAKQVICVEKNLEVAKFLKQNLAIAEENPTIIIGDALKVLKRLNRERFDLIFIDPPYSSGLYKTVLEKIKEYEILNDRGFIVIEHDCRIEINIDEIFEVYKAKKYGDTCVTILCKGVN